ncbi:MAG: 50S ribosomal protein L24 [Pseudomonadota bacterium]
MESKNCKLKKDDEIIVIAGKDKGNRGTITKVLGDKVLVAGINMVKKHQKPDPNRDIKGGIIDMEAPIHISNIAIYNNATGKADRIGYKFDNDGKKFRIFKSSGERVDI